MAEVATLFPDDDGRQPERSIRNLVDEIIDLSTRNLSVERFYFEFISRVVRALGAVDGIVWRPNLPSGAEIIAQSNAGESRIVRTENLPFGHRVLLHEISLGGDSAVVPPHDPNALHKTANTAPFLLLVCPVRRDETTFQIVEIFQRPNPSMRTQRGYMRFLVQMCEVAANFMQRQAK